VVGWVGGCQEKAWKFQEIFLNAKKEIENIFFLPHQGAFNIYFFIQKRILFSIHFSQKGFHFSFMEVIFF
jgi:hypothetical protein